jgi:hypothetical protein
MNKITKNQDLEGNLSDDLELETGDDEDELDFF